jgi:MOSC domain-containing protein YiiM
MAKIVSIAYSPLDAEPHPADAYQRVPMAQAVLVVGQGIQGDRKGRSPKRQLNIMRAEVLEAMQAEGYKTAPGQMGEQLVIGGLAPDALKPGARLLVGASAQVEVLSLRTGCERFEHIQGHSPEEAAGRLGMMARVVAGGPITVGDPVRLTEIRPA